MTKPKGEREAKGTEEVKKRWRGNKTGKDEWNEGGWKEPRLFSVRRGKV